jgi:ABC-type Zn uptake system ZnuABC Zn-binding protein ZnuA
VVAALAPIADLVRQVGGDLVDVTSMVPAGADAHTYEPRPRDVVGLADADLYIGIGLSLNDGVLRLAQENLRDGASLVLLGEVALADDDLVFDHAHDHDDGHGHTHSHGDNGHSHSHGDADDEPGPNPHVWTSLRNTMSLVQGIAEALSAADPEHAGTTGSGPPTTSRNWRRWTGGSPRRSPRSRTTTGCWSSITTPGPTSPVTTAWT